MVNTLSDKLPDYGGQVEHARCFLYMTNLVAKSLLHAFDVKWGNIGDAGLDQGRNPTLERNRGDGRNRRGRCWG
ncbi:hypothetical protein J3R83DRAFT_9590 [Lanmaoa asiatica]|nr:hypothetical protein J3R83DRAFT_9590 [Lanmaoa asiatica]